MLLFCVRVIGCVRLQCTVRRALGCACKRYVLYRRQREMGLGVRVSGRGGEGAAARAPNIARRSLRALSSGPWMRDLFAYGRRAPRFPFFRNGRRRNFAAAECGVIGAELTMLRYLFMERAAALARTLLRRGGGFDDVTELFLRRRETLILWCWHLVTLLRSMPTLACWRVGPSWLRSYRLLLHVYYIGFCWWPE